MKKRCYYTAHQWYEYYGGRGISVCARWLEHGTGFANFLQDMGPRPSPGHDLDRIDPDGHYTPENCRWLPKEINRDWRGRDAKLEDADHVPF